MYVHVCGVSPEEGVVYVVELEFRVVGSYPVWVLELNRVLCKSSKVFLTAEPPVQSQETCISKYSFNFIIPWLYFFFFQEKENPFPLLLNNSNW